MVKEMQSLSSFLSRTAKGCQPNAIRKLVPMLTRKGIISFAAGAPSPETFPVEELSEIAARVILNNTVSALQYGMTRGLDPLIEQVAAYMQARGIGAPRLEDISMTTGSQQGLDLAARAIIDPGDIAFVELPSYVGGTISLNNAGAEFIGVKQDEEGLVTGDLREKIKCAMAAGKRLKCIYTIPNFQNPSGVSLSMKRRQELAAIADEYNLIIIEDDPYFELFFSEKTERVPLAALIPSRVIYMSSFSKVLAPGLRSAWLSAPREIAEKIELIKEGADLFSSTLDQAIVLEAAQSGLIEKRLPLIREFYSVRCSTMLEALNKFAPKGSRWPEPTGGFFILMELPEGKDATAILPSAIEAGVAFVPGQPFFVNNSGANTLRLAYSKENPEMITKGMEVLCEVLSR